MKKKIYMITASKGGCGKSTLCWLLAEKYKDAIVLDLDDATKTTIKQLAYRKPPLISFLDPTTQRIDRGAFTGFFESVSETKKELFLADLGASVAEQLPKYFSINGADVIKDLLTFSGIDLQIICIVGGGNIFKATMEYLNELIESTDSTLEVVVAHNGLHPLAPEQHSTLVEYTTTHKLPLVSFDLVKDKGEMAMRTVANVLKDGKGTAGLSPFTAIYFKKPIEELNL